MACGGALTQTDPASPQSADAMRNAALQRNRSATSRAERRDAGAARRAAHQAAAPLRRNERRHCPDRRVAQRREPYLGEIPPSSDAFDGNGNDVRRAAIPSRSGRHRVGWFMGWTMLVLLAVSGALIASNPAWRSAAADFADRAAGLAGIVEDPGKREREGRFGTSPQELPYDGMPQEHEDKGLPPVSIPQENVDTMSRESSGGVAAQEHREAGNERPEAPAPAAAESASAQQSDLQPAPQEPPKAVKPKPKPRPRQAGSAVRSREIDRLRNQAYSEGSP